MNGEPRSYLEFPHHLIVIIAKLSMATLLRQRSMPVVALMTEHDCCCLNTSCLVWLAYNKTKCLLPFHPARNSDTTQVTEVVVCQCPSSLNHPKSHGFTRPNPSANVDWITPSTDPSGFRLDFVEVYAPSPELCEELDLQTYSWAIKHGNGKPMEFP